MPAADAGTASLGSTNSPSRPNSMVADSAATRKSSMRTRINGEVAGGTPPSSGVRADRSNSKRVPTESRIVTCRIRRSSSESLVSSGSPAARSTASSTSGHSDTSSSIERSGSQFRITASRESSAALSRRWDSNRSPDSEAPRSNTIPMRTSGTIATPSTSARIRNRKEKRRTRGQSSGSPPRPGTSGPSP